MLYALIDGPNGLRERIRRAFRPNIPEPHPFTPNPSPNWQHELYGVMTCYPIHTTEPAPGIPERHRHRTHIVESIGPNFIWTSCGTSFRRNTTRAIPLLWGSVGCRACREVYWNRLKAQARKMAVERQREAHYGR